MDEWLITKPWTLLLNEIIYETWTSNYAHCFVWALITHPCTNLNNSLVKAPLKFGWDELLHPTLVGGCDLNHYDNQPTLQWRYNERDDVSNPSQITRDSIVYSIFSSGADKRKYQSYASLAFVRGIHRWPVDSPPKGPVTRKMFPFDDVIMCVVDVVDVREKPVNGSRGPVFKLLPVRDDIWPPSYFDSGVKILQRHFDRTHPHFQYLDP